LFNEEPLQGTPEGRNIFRRMKSLVLKLDDTRLITGAMNGGISVDEGAALEMDITGINYNIKGIPAFHEKYPGQPLVGSENNSAVSTRGCYRSDRDNEHVLNNYDEEVVPWGQQIKTTWDFTRKNDYMAGIFIWTGFDYRGEPTPFTWPSVSSQFGIMDTCGFAKESFYFNKACFTDEPMLHLMPHWNWNAGDMICVMTITNCDEAELFLNGETLGRKSSDVCSQCEWLVPFEAGILQAKAYLNGKEVISTETRTTGRPVRVRIEPDRANIMDDGADTVPINICALDANGLVVPTASNFIRFIVEGDGKVLGTGNGDPNSHEADNAPERSLFAGWCQALIQSSVGAKALKVTAVSEGLISDTIIFEVNKVDKPEYIYATVNQQINGWTVSAGSFDTEPDALMKIADNDMNSFEPVTFGSKYQADFKSGYKIYRTFIKIPKSANPEDEHLCEIKFGKLTCESAAVYADDKLIYCGNPAEDSSLSLAFETIPDARTELRVLLKAKEGTASGIRNEVKLSSKQI
ncbi:MAG: DUF4982 domain-containing protein, partial [Eubacteriales bacterium]|nr:DUF4982 domain-containing protein [Eubacteriales bacterium]